MVRIEDVRACCTDDTIVLTEHLLTRMRQRQTMKCGICKAEMDETTVTYTEDIAQGVIVIRHVPAHVCTECGNTWYSGTIAAQLEKMIDRFASSTGTEVSVINFEKSVA